MEEVEDSPDQSSPIIVLLNTPNSQKVEFWPRNSLFLRENEAWTAEDGESNMASEAVSWAYTGFQGGGDGLACSNTEKN